MKRVDVVYGVLERFNDLLGSTDSGDSSDLSLTEWSIQGTMIENLRRMVKSFSGDSGNGRIGYGLDMSPSGGVSEGVGFTAAGEIIFWAGLGRVPSEILKYGADQSGNATDVSLYLKYTSVRTEEHHSETSSIAKYEVGEPVHIIIDNDTDVRNVFTNTPSDDTVLIAKYDIISGSVVPGSIRSGRRGFSVTEGDAVEYSDLEAGNLIVKKSMWSMDEDGRPHKGITGTASSTDAITIVNGLITKVGP